MSLADEVKGATLFFAVVGGFYFAAIKTADYLGVMKSRNQIVSFFQEKEQRAGERMARLEYLTELKQAARYCIGDASDTPFSNIGCYYSGDIDFFSTGGGADIQ